MPNIFHFAINADDVPRARRFYEQAFGWSFNAWGPPNFYMIETKRNGEAAGIHGSLQGRRDLVAGQRMTGFECTIAVPNIDETAAAITNAGGKVIMQKSIIVGVGALMFFQDTEGNSFGVIQPDNQAE
jgi:predicted enzyme related to lactoylglutathione lyase